MSDYREELVNGLDKAARTIRASRRIVDRLIVENKALKNRVAELEAALAAEKEET